MRWSGILATWPSHSKQRFFTVIVTVSGSPPDLHCCDVLFHCCLLEIPKMVTTHLLWKESRFFNCFFIGVQHSESYNSTESVQAWYTFVLVVTSRSWSMNTGFLSASQSNSSAYVRLAFAHKMKLWNPSTGILLLLIFSHHTYSEVSCLRLLYFSTIWHWLIVVGMLSMRPKSLATLIHIHVPSTPLWLSLHMFLALVVAKSFTFSAFQLYCLKSFWS